MAYALSLNNADEDEGEDTEFSGEGDEDDGGGTTGNDFPDYSAADGRTFRDPDPTQSQENLDGLLDVDLLSEQITGGEYSN
jgi:hypothetical protein